MTHKPSGRRRHSFIQFYMADWLAGTARMSRMIRSIYFDICVYNWDKGAPVPAAELYLMLSDLDDGLGLVNVLVESGQLIRDDAGCVSSPRAMAEAERALAAWEAKSAGGRGGKHLPTPLEVSSEVSSQHSSTEPEPEPEPDIPVGTAPRAAINLSKELFSVGVAFLTSTGKTERGARSVIGKLRKARGDDAVVLAALAEAQTKGIGEPVEWLTKRLVAPRYVSKTGYEYKGTLAQIKREAEKRHDMDTYWSVKGDMEKAENK